MSSGAQRDSGRGRHPGRVPVAGILMTLPAIGGSAWFFAPEAEAVCTVLPVRMPDCSARSVPRLHRVMTSARLPKRNG
jgi:hypothetical protein